MSGILDKDALNPLESSRDSENKYILLKRVFPTIYADRDLDLDQYLQLRETGKPADQWKRHYDKLTFKYTEEERKILIHVMRKFSRDFNKIFSVILERVFNRLTHHLRKKINLILHTFGGSYNFEINTDKDRLDLITKIRKSLQVCSLNHADAYNDVLLLEYYSKTFNFKSGEFENAIKWIKLYLNGMLFTPGAKEYKFDINEERRMVMGDSGKSAFNLDQMSLQFFISTNDMKQIQVERKTHDEYDLAFAFFEKYFTMIQDVSFANKLFIYSKTNKTNHFKIYEAIRRGLKNRYSRERIFDDVFKIICNGKYIYNITKEQIIQRKIFLFSKSINSGIKQHTPKPIIQKTIESLQEKQKRSADKVQAARQTVSVSPTEKSDAPAEAPEPENKQELQRETPVSKIIKEIKNDLLDITKHDKAAQQSVPETTEFRFQDSVKLSAKNQAVLKDKTITAYPVKPPVKSSTVKAIEPDKTPLPVQDKTSLNFKDTSAAKRGNDLKSVEKKNRAALPALPANKTAIPDEKKRTITEMIDELTADLKERRFLIDEFKHRLSANIIKSWKQTRQGPLDDPAYLKGFNDFTKFVAADFDIFFLGKMAGTAIDGQIKKYGFSSKLLSAMIFECFVELKSDFLLHNIKPGRMSGLLNVVNRMLGNENSMD